MPRQPNMIPNHGAIRGNIAVRVRVGIMIRIRIRLLFGLSQQ